MKTTIELSDDLVMEAKKLAIERRTTLRALVEQGLRRELGMPAEPASHPLERIATLNAEIWRGVEADRYVAGERADWE